jgi:hypothetical protein
LGVLFDHSTKALASDAADHLADRDRADPAFWLSESHKASPRQVRGNLARGAAIDKQADQGSELFQQRFPVGGAGSLKDVLDAERGRAGGAVQREAPENFLDHILEDICGDGELVESWDLGSGGRRVEGTELISGFLRFVEDGA